MIPGNIDHEHIMNAIREIDGGKEMPLDRDPHKYRLILNGKTYPPKFTISLANKYANGNELASREFSGEDESITFLTSRGFEVVPIDDAFIRYDDKLLDYLRPTFKVDINKIKRSWLQFKSSGITLYVNGSKKHERGNGGWYDLEQDIFLSLIHKPSSYYAVVLDEPSKTFVLPMNVVNDIFGNQPTVGSTEDGKKKPRWMFSISENVSKYLLTVNNKKIDISEYLNKWDVIPEFTYNNEILNGEKNETPKEIDVHSFVFLTGYDERNLKISKQLGILGWANNSHFLSVESLVFVFNKDTLRLETCFKILSKSYDMTPIWENEKTVGKVIYGNRWNAEIIRDGIDIPITDINKISPFDKEPFQGLLRGNFPMPLNSPKNRAKYEPFLKQLLRSIQNQANHWIFVVTDHHKLSTEEIYNTRMKDRFWGLNKGTPHRKNLKKGDKVIFAQGAKRFLGTALLDSDPFELMDTDKEALSHGIEFYNTQYGVRLCGIVTWRDQKKVENYVNSLSFIHDPRQYSVYFQGGIKKISISDYDTVVNADESPQDSTFRETSLWLVRAGDLGQGEQTALEKNLVGIGYGGLPGLDSINEFDAFKEHYKQTHPSATPGYVGQVVPQIWHFMHDIRKGDLVILPLKTSNSKLIAVGQIMGDYEYKDLHSEIKQFRPVKWFKKDVPRNEFDPEVEAYFDAHGTVRCIGNSSLVNKVKSMLKRLGIDTNNIGEVALNESLESVGYLIPVEYRKSWLSLTEHEIEEITDQVLGAGGKKLEIERSVIRRIISHLILSKHVILVGPPGTGKTDLARRLLRELGKNILGKSEPIEKVASYEWGRYEVIGGISITADSKGDPFHLGCVTHAIKEGKLLLIDEFNRADMNKAFGEMFLALDHGIIQLKVDEKPLGFLFKSPNEIEIPSYFRMICTMNDYDKSLLNELSYGLLRRFAFVEIKVPNEKKKVIDIVIERAKKDLKELNVKVLENSTTKIETHVDKFAEFLISISEKRQIGISSYIDVIRFVLFRVSITNDDPWDVMNDALTDYILPQFDRLDFDTLDFAHKIAFHIFKNDKGTIPELQPFLNALNDKIKTLQNLNNLFTTGEST
jgi:MoxR-like ATPase